MKSLSVVLFLFPAIASAVVAPTQFTQVKCQKNSSSTVTAEALKSNESLSVWGDGIGKERRSNKSAGEVYYFVCSTVECGKYNLILTEKGSSQYYKYSASCTPTTSSRPYLVGQNTVDADSIVLFVPNFTQSGVVSFQNSWLYSGAKSGKTMQLPGLVNIYSSLSAFLKP